MRRAVSTFLAIAVFATTVLNGSTAAFAETNRGIQVSEDFLEDETDNNEWAHAFQMRLAQIPENGRQEGSEEITEKNRRVLDFNTNWLFIRGDDLNAKDPDYDESSAEKVSLPHARRNYDLYKPDIKDVQTVDWYRRHFTVPSEHQGSRVFVEFNGGGQVNNIYVNGALAGQAKGTFTHFKFDITDYITFGEYDNVIALQVDSRYHGDSMPPGTNIDFHMFGGLHGSAKMTITDKAYVESAFYWNENVTESDTEAAVNGKIEVKNEYLQPQEITVKSVIKRGDGETDSVQEKTETVEAGELKVFELVHTIQDPHLWSPSDPYLYTASTEILIREKSVDQYEDNIGIRTLSATKPSEKHGYFTLNGERIELVGGNRHMMAPYLGNSLTKKLNEKDAYTMKYDLGINMVRTSHYEADPSFLDACDRIGLMVEEEALGWQDTPGWEQFCYSAEEMVKRDRNHASIVMWSIIPNERPLNYPSVQSGKDRQAKTKELDPSRLTIQEEMTRGEVIADVYGWHDYALPGNFSVPNPEIKSWFVTEWNTNLGKHFVIPGDSETRKRNQVIQDGLKMGYFMADPRIMGNLKWDIFGYLTPQNANQRGKNVNLLRCSGVYGQWRDPLHKTWIAYLMQAQSDVAEIGDVLKICSEWKSDSDREIYVISNLEEVELYYGNGGSDEKLVERLNAPNVYQDKLKCGMFLYQLPEDAVWTRESRLIAKGYKDGNPVPAKEQVVWASTYESEKEGAELILHNTMEQDFNAGISLGGLEADGSDAAWILAELVDRNGQREYYGDENVTLDLEGPGELVYAGGNPIMADGLSGFYVRSNLDETGTAKVTVSVDIGENYDDQDVSITYDNNWQAVDSKKDAYGSGLHQSKAAGAAATIKFTGTQLVLYAESSDKNGTATAVVGEDSQKVDFSNESKYDTISNQAVYRSPVLKYGEHTLTVTANTDKPINIDRIKVFDGQSELSKMIDIEITESSAERVRSDTSLPKAEMPEINNVEMLKILLDEARQITLSNYKAEEQISLKEAMDFAQSVAEMGNPPMSIISKAVAKLRAAMVLDPYVTRIMNTDTAMEGQNGVYYYSEVDGTWVLDRVSYYANKKRTPNDYVEITFEGCKIQLFTKMDSAHGLAAVSVDGKSEVKVDQYSSTARDDSLFYISEILEPGRHTVKVRVTGETSGNPNNACISFSYAVVHKELDMLQESKTELAASLATADVLDRSLYTLDSLDLVDAAVEKAADILKDKNTTIEAVEKAKAELDEAIAALETSQEFVTIQCGDKAETEGQLNKVRYTAKNTSWVDEMLGNDSKQNTYLKKVNQTAKEDYCEVFFEGTKIDLFAKCSTTSGLAWIQIDDQAEEEWESISLYADVSPNAASVKKIYTSPELEEGQHTLRLITQNKADPRSSDKSLTSINFSKAVVSRGSQNIDISALRDVIERVNGQTSEGVHEQLWAAFQEKIRTAIRKSYGLLTGEFPELAVSDPLPAGTTGVRTKRVVIMLEAAIQTLKGQLDLISVDSLAGITVPYGTVLDEIPFPVRVKAMTSDQQPLYAEIAEWEAESAYDPETPGNYNFNGELVLEEGLVNTQELTAKIKIKVAEPDEVFYQINAVIEGGQTASVTVIDQALPGDKVTVQISDIPEGWEFDRITAAAEFEKRTELREHNTLHEEEIAEESDASTVTIASDSNAQSGDTKDSETKEPEIKESEVIETVIKKITMTEVTPGEEYSFIMPAADVTITVILKEYQSISVERIIVSGSDSVKVGDTVTLRAKVVPANAEYEIIEWRVSGNAAEYEEDGNTLLLTGIKPGKVKITALAGGVWSKTFTLNVTKKSGSNSTNGSSGSSGKSRISTSIGLNTYGPGVNFALTAEEILNKLEQTAPDESLVIRRGIKDTLDVSVLNALREKHPGKILVINGNGYRWIFDGKDLTVPAEGFAQLDTEIICKSSNPEITPLLGGTDAQIIHFNHQGQLPGKVRIGIFDGGSEGESVNIYYYNRQEHRLELAAEKRPIDKDGWFEFEVTQGADYVVSKTEIAGVVSQSQ